jgi:uncharacterized membrane protein
MYAKARLDALSDGIFAVAMTLLALDLRLPEDFKPQDTHQFLQGLIELWPKLLPFLLSFSVLGLRWSSNILVRSNSEYVGREYVRWCLFYLLLITCVPFSTMVVGRYPHFAPAIWLYAGLTMTIALVSIRLTAVTPDLQRDHHLHHRLRAIRLLIASSLARHRDQLRGAAMGTVGLR